MTANDSKSYLGYLKKLVKRKAYADADADYFAMTEKLNRVIKLLNLKLVIESELPSTRIFLAKVTPKIDQEKYLLLILC